MSKGSSSNTESWNPTQSGEWQQYRSLVEPYLAGVGELYDKEFAGGEDTFAGWSPEQESLFERLAGGGGALDSAISGLEQTLGPYNPNNPALTAAIDAASGDVTRNLERNLLPALGTEATQAGQFGSSRHGIAEGLALSDASGQISDLSSNMRLSDMQQWQSNQQNAMANLGSLTEGFEYTAGGSRREEQASIDDMLRRWEYESTAPLQELTAIRDLLNVDMGGSGRSAGSGGGGK